MIRKRCHESVPDIVTVGAGLAERPQTGTGTPSVPDTPRKRRQIRQLCAHGQQVLAAMQICTK